MAVHSALWLLLGFICRMWYLLFIFLSLWVIESLLLSNKNTMTHGPVFCSVSPLGGELVLNADKSGVDVKVMRSKQCGIFL